MPYPSGLSGILAHEVTGLYERGKLTSAEDVLVMVRAKIEKSQDHRILRLEDILQSEDKPDNLTAQIKEKDAEPGWVRSMFGFPLFLQHTLRIWLLDNEHPDDLPRLLDRELLELFEDHFFNGEGDRRANVKSFIKLLWKLRVLFDQHFIKWVDQDEEEMHLISQISISTSGDKRYMHRSRDTDSHRAFALLQSMLYHSQEITTQYWVTPLLAFIHRNPGKPVEQYFAYLRHLDNHLLGSANDESLVKRTWSFMKDPWQCRELIHKEALQKDDGVHFAHYWFYKLDFVLWFQNRNTRQEWKNFRLTAKSSVEHISPQNPTARDNDLVDKALHHFGNLALVSRSLNSEYGNLPFNEKQRRFLNKIREKGRVDSLKMHLIYENEQWGDDEAFAHQAAMIECLDSYCCETPEESTADAWTTTTTTTPL
jgi:hypothetical protein